MMSVMPAILASLGFLAILRFVYSADQEHFYRLMSYNFRNHNVGLNINGVAAITTTKETFHIVTPGLIGTPGTVSFESVRYPGRYLRHRSYVIHLDTFKAGNHLLLKQDASFYPRTGKYFQGYTAYESYNFPAHFIRHQNGILRISKAANAPTELFKMDASFLPVSNTSAVARTPFALYSSSNFPDHAIGFMKDGLPAIVKTDPERFRMVIPGLNGQRGTISLESERYPGHYLRHRKLLIHLDDFQETNVYFHDATFRLKQGVFEKGSVSFESVNFPNHYIRHQGYRLKLHANDGSPLFKKDASFVSDPGTVGGFRREGPYRFISKNYPNYTLGLDNNGTPSLTEAGIDKFYLVRPGLSRVEGTISLASATFPGQYLRHRNDLIRLDPYEESKVYRHDATFILRENHFYQGYVAMESLCFAGFFMRHQGYLMKISENDASDLFRNDGSFKMVM